MCFTYIIFKCAIYNVCINIVCININYPDEDTGRCCAPRIPLCSGQCPLLSLDSCCSDTSVIMISFTWFICLFLRWSHVAQAGL